MSVDLNQSYYTLLEVPKTATESEIRIAYKKQALKYHPDKVAQDLSTQEKATAAFKQVSEAYETLSDPQKRRTYDLKSTSRVFTSPSTSSKASYTQEDFFDETSRCYRQKNTKPSYTREDFFDETFHFYNQKNSWTYKSEPVNEVIYPDKMDTEASNVINSDNPDLVDQFIKNKSLKNTFIKSMLYEACKNGKFNVVKYFIEVRKLNPSLSVSISCFFTGPIFKAAAESGNLELVKYLLEGHKADIESQGLSGGTKDTALSRAAAKGHANVVEYLIFKGANLNPEVSNSDILNQAIDSQNLAVVKLLIESGTKIENFALNHALKVGALTIVKYLLEKRPGIKTHWFSSSTPACIVVGSGNVELVKYLIEKEDLDLFEEDRYVKDSIGLILHAGTKSHSIEMMRFLLEENGLGEKVLANVSYIQTMLAAAAKNHFFIPTKNQIQAHIQFLHFLMEEKQFKLPKDKMKSLIETSADFSGIEVNSYLQSYLYDSEDSKKMLQKVALQGLESINFENLLKLYNSKMIKKGKCSDFSSEIHDHIKQRKLSLEQLKKFFIENNPMMTEALFYFSSYYHKEDIAALELLVELGVDLNAENANGIAAIHVAIDSGGYNKIVQFYLNNQADLSKKNKKEQTAAEILKKYI